MDRLTFYNYKTLHSSLGYVGSRAFEQRGGRGTAARQEVRLMGSLWSAENRGKVNFTMGHKDTPADAGIKLVAVADT